MKFYLFVIHAAISTIFCGIFLYFPGHKELLVLVNWYMILQGVAAIALVFLASRNDVGSGIVWALIVSVWGFCCAVVAEMSLGNSWL